MITDEFIHIIEQSDDLDFDPVLHHHKMGDNFSEVGGKYYFW